MLKILIIRFSSIGDIVLTSPVPRLLKKKFPNSKIHFITKKRYQDLYRYNKNIDRIILFKKNLFLTAIKLRYESYDFVIDLHNNLRSIFLRFILFKKSYIYNKEFIKRWLIVNFKLKIRLPHIAESYILTLKPLGINDDLKGLDYFFSYKDIFESSWLPSSHKKNYIILVLGAKYFTKRLPTNKAIELCDKLNSPIILLGGKDAINDANVIENFFNKSKNFEKKIYNTLNKKTKIVNMCGKLSINQSAFLLKNADMVYTNDTGLMHIAAALKKKVVGIWGSTHPNLGFYPFETKFAIYQNNNLSCRPCTKIGHSKCPLNHFKCMNDLKFDDVIL